MLLELPGTLPKAGLLVIYILKWRYMASKFLSLFSEHLPLMCEVRVCGTNGMVVRLLGHEPARLGPCEVLDDALVGLRHDESRFGGSDFVTSNARVRGDVPP
jgi:hypothetical protein